MKEIFKGKKILVTGGTGSIGYGIVKHLLTYDVAKVIVFSRDEIKHFMMNKKILDHRLLTVVGDVRNRQSLKRLFESQEIDIIYHAAAMKHVVVCEQTPIECVSTNILGTQNLMDLASEYRIKKVITISTDKVAHPTNVMGSAKFIAERITLNSGYTCVRFGNVANTRGSVIPVFLDNLVSRKPLCITDRNVTRFIIQLNDAVRLIFQATKNSSGGEIYILKMKSFKLGDLVDVMLNNIAPAMKIRENEIAFEETGLILGEKLHEELINSTESNNLYEIDDMYVVMKPGAIPTNLPNLKKTSMKSYSSADVEMLTKTELELIVKEYLNIYGSMVVQ